MVYAKTKCVNVCERTQSEKHLYSSEHTLRRTPDHLQYLETTSKELNLLISNANDANTFKNMLNMNT